MAVAERRDESISRQIALCASNDAQVSVDLPMSLPWRDQYRSGFRQESTREFEGSLDGSRWVEYSGVGGHPNEAAEHNLGQPKRLVRRRRGCEPVPIPPVIGRPFVERVHQNVDVGENQLSVPSINSTRAELSSRSTPG